MSRLLVLGKQTTRRSRSSADLLTVSTVLDPSVWMSSTAAETVPWMVLPSHSITTHTISVLVGWLSLGRVLNEARHSTHESCSQTYLNSDLVNVGKDDMVT